MNEIPLQAVFAGVGLLFTGFSALAGVWWNVVSSINSAKTEFSHKMRNSEQMLEGRRSALEREMQDFKLHVAESYASWNTVKEIEARLGTRMDNLTEKVIAMPDLLVERVTKLIDLANKN
jgi:hypothetical protein